MGAQRLPRESKRTIVCSDARESPEKRQKTANNERFTALQIYFLISKAKLLSLGEQKSGFAAKEEILAGGPGTPAASIYYALKAKSRKWLQKLFGPDATEFLKRLTDFTKTDPTETKPVRIYYVKDHLPLEKLRITDAKDPLPREVLIRVANYLLRSEKAWQDKQKIPDFELPASQRERSATKADNPPAAARSVPPPPPPKQAFDPALMPYLRWLSAQCEELPLMGEVKVKAAGVESVKPHLNLYNVYVRLNVELKTAKGERAVLSALKATHDHWHVVLLGAPGSGKSSFLNYLCYCLAQHQLAPDEGHGKRLEDWAPDLDLAPIRVVLRDFIRQVAPQISKCKPNAQRLFDYAEELLKAEEFESSTLEAVKKAIQEKRILLVLDGLDEIPSEHQRVFLQSVIADLRTKHPDLRLIVTCRVRSYDEAQWRLEGFTPLTLAVFTDEQIRRFITIWYEGLAPWLKESNLSQTQLATSLRREVNKLGLKELAPNPLLLPIMALIHASEQQLPDARALLYEKMVDLLLWRWDQIRSDSKSGDPIPSVGDLLKQIQATTVELKPVLWKLAYDSRLAAPAGQASSATITSDQLEQALINLISVEKIFDDKKEPLSKKQWVRRVIETMEDRLGLLLACKNKVFTFPHPTFQEYLAGAYLTEQRDFPRSMDKNIKDAEDVSYWFEFLRLAVGRLIHLKGDYFKPLALAVELCQEDKGSEDRTWERIRLAVEVFKELGPDRMRESALGRELLERFQLRFFRDMFDEVARKPKQHAIAGMAVVGWVILAGAWA